MGKDVAIEGLTLQARLTLIAGKGGVGKTTIACALAARAARLGSSVLVISTDPAHSLADSFGVSVAGDPTSVADRLWAIQVNPKHSLETFLSKHRSTMQMALDRGTYLDGDDISALLALPLPGIDEVTALLEVMRLLPDRRWHYVVVDTAPTGHAERLLRMPDAFAKFAALLDALQERHRFLVARLAGAYHPDDVDSLLWQLHADAEDLRSKLQDPLHTQAILVSAREPVVQAETLRYLQWLRDDGLAVVAVVLNRWEAGCPASSNQGSELLQTLRTVADPLAIHFAPDLRHPVSGRSRLERFGAILEHRWHPPAGCDKPCTATDTLVPLALPFVEKPLQFFMGKGGAGKTTLAAANALALAALRGPILLISLDPAHSLGDVWMRPIGDEAVEVAPGLWALEVDAAKRWEAIRSGWQRTLAEARDNGAAAGLPGWRETATDLAHVLDLLPPGVDEVIGFFVLDDLHRDGGYRAIVVDCAPTGHFLRLLALPELALDWVHMLMRLCLKYRELVGLQGLAEDLLGMAKRLKSTIALLRDPERCAFVPIALPEQMVIEETQRLIDALDAAGMPIEMIVLNKRRSCTCGRCQTSTGEEARQADRLRALYAYPVVDVPLQPAPPAGRDALAGLSNGRPAGRG